MLKTIKEFKISYKIVDATKSIDDIFKEIIQKIEEQTLNSKILSKN